MRKLSFALALIALLAAFAKAQAPDDAAYTADITKRANDAVKAGS